MGIVSFLFGFHGRINRTSFFLASTAQGLLVLAAAIVLASQGALPDIKSITAAGDNQTNILGIKQQASGVFIVWSIVQLPLIFKRVRDMHKALTFAWIYGFCVFIGTAPGFYMFGHVAATILITWFSMHGSRAAGADNVDIISTDELAWNTDTALDKIDLVARARELKAAETRLQAEHAKQDEPKIEAKPAFGKRAGMTAGSR